MKPLTHLLLLSGVVAGFLGFAETSQAKSEAALSNNQADDSVWITLGVDAVETIQLKYSTKIPMQLSGIIGIEADNPVAIAQLPESKIIELSQVMHTEHKRCGGFIYHDSQQAAQQYAHQLNQTMEFAQVNYTINNPEEVNKLVAEINSSDMSDTVDSLSNYYNRYYSTETGVESAQWIKNQWQTIAAQRNDIQVELYEHNSWNQPSVVATIMGTSSPADIVIVGGHLDSINSYSPTGRAPGADDNASGIAVLTETLKAIVNSGFKPERTIKIIGYAAEEVGLRGSQEIARQHKATNSNVLGVVQFDMSGYKGSDADIVFMTDYTNQEQNQFLADLIDTYLPSVNYAYGQCGYGCSDHASWHNEGYPASMPFEAKMGQHNSDIHSADDDHFDAEHSANFARLSVAFLVELAKGSSDPTKPPPPPGDNVLENGVPETGLSASTGNDIVYSMEVPTGASNINFSISGGSGDADLYVKKGSIPTDSSYDCRPYRNGNSESCSGSGGGTYYVRVKAYSSFSNVTLVGNYDEVSDPGPQPVDRTISNISVAQNSWANYTQDLGEGYNNLTVTITGGSGDADLYVRRGSAPTTSSYDCRPYKWGNEEVCTFNAPQSGTWHIGIRGYNASSGVTLRIEATPQ